MSRQRTPAFDSENEARFRAYLNEIPAYMEGSWAGWICNSDSEASVLLCLSSEFGVNLDGQRRSHPPNREKELRRRWVAITYKTIGDKFLLETDEVRRAVKGLERKRFVEVSLHQFESCKTPHFFLNWDQVLQALVEYVTKEEQAFMDKVTQVVEEGKAKKKRTKKRKKREL